MGDRDSTDVVHDRLRQAKRPITVLAGPYGHPLHPLLVTVPIGAWVASLVFDLASRTADEADVFAKGAYWLIVLGLVGALAAATVGLLDLFAIPLGTRAFRVGLTHMALTMSVTGLFALSLALRQGDIDAPGETGVGLVALSAGALGALAVAGWFGGRLSFRFGVRVADEAAQLDGFVGQADHEIDNEIDHDSNHDRGN